MLETLQIIEYEKKYAAKVAEMWNKSTEGWQGGISEISYGRKLAKFGGLNRNERLYFTKPLMTDFVNLGANTETILANNSQIELVENKEEKIFKPGFIIFSKKDIDKNSLKMLLHLEFKKN